MKKAEQGQQTRRELLRMGANLFALHGYHHTSTTEILAAAAISKGAFYHHFTSKEDFALAILSQLQQDYLEKVVGPIETDSAPDQRLGAALEKIVQLNSSAKWCNCRLLARLTQDVGSKENDLSRKVGETVDFLLSFLTRCVEEAIQSGAIKPSVNPQTLAQLILTTLFGTLILNALDDSPLEIAALVEQLQALVTTTD